MKPVLVLLAAAIFAVGCATTTPAVREPEPLLWPRPRSCQYLGGTLKLPLSRRLQFYCPQTLADSTAVKAMTDLFREVADMTPTQLDGRDGLCIWTQDCKPLSNKEIQPEGYCLDVSKEGIGLKAADAVGLLNGVRTLRQLVRLTDDAYEIPLVRIHDAPALAERGYHYMMCEADYSEKTVENVKKYISALAQMKINVILLQLDALPDYRSVKLDTYIATWPMEKLAEIGSHARSEGVEVVPLLGLGGHCRWFLRTPGFEKFWERAGERKAEDIDFENSMLCPGQNDELLPILFGMMDELVDALQAKRFHIAYDEIYLSDRTCPACVPQPFHIQEMYARQVNAIAAHLKERGVKTVMWGDRPLTIPLRKLLGMDLDLATHPMLKWLSPNNLEIMNWYYGKNPEAFPKVVEYYHEAGFHDQSLAVMCFDDQAENGLKSALATHTPALYNTLWFHSNGCRDMQFSVDSWNNLPYFADLAWNGALPPDGAPYRNRLNVVRNTYTGTFPVRMVPTDRQRILLNAEGGKAVKTADGVELRLGEPMALNEPAVWNVSCKAERALAVFDMPSIDFGDVNFTERNFSYPLVAVITWSYADGTEDSVPVVYEWQAGPSSDQREYFAAETVAADDGTLHRVASLSNPHPEKEIVRVSVKQTRDGVTLSALTVVKPKKRR